ncbi:MAG: oligosaccharide flippase family protein, partial [Candidatus Sumerlaeaceae bacterium]|nr:oligosaccharide flippase family protein [Candidatus Sumerlaeaceae bacterium]
MRFGKLTSDAAVVALGRLAVPAAALATNMILARTLTRAGMGQVQEINVHVQVVVNILTVGLQTSLYNFLPRIELSQRRAYVWRNLWATVILGVGTGAVVAAEAPVFARWVGTPEIAPLVRIASLALVASILATVVDPLFI